MMKKKVSAMKEKAKQEKNTSKTAETSRMKAESSASEMKKTSAEAAATESGKKEAAEAEEAGKKEAGEWKAVQDAASEKYEKLKKDYDELEKKRLLLLADMDNQRKRFAKDLEALRYSVMEDTLFPFLQVFEHFSMAVAAAAASDNYKSLLQGMDMIQKEFDKAFSELGVIRIDAVGQEFDPKLHEAVAQEASDTVPAGRIIRQWSHGYKKGDRLLKPAMVVVSSGPAGGAE